MICLSIYLPIYLSTYLYLSEYLSIPQVRVFGFWFRLANETFLKPVKQPTLRG